MSDVTVVILTKNEELNIVDAVENAKKLTERVLLIDSGSTDDTINLAKRNGANVLHKEWDNDFSAQRNFALEHVDKPSDVLKIGQEIEAKVVDFNLESKKISLSIKALLAPAKDEDKAEDEQ